MAVAEGRQQFTFYRSFWEAFKGLPKKDRLPILEAIIEYALDEKPPSGLNQTQSAFFSLVKPTLDASRKKAESGKQGGSKTKANGKQIAREKEREKEKEKENEIEGEKEKKHPLSDELFSLFWDNYPAVGRENREEAHGDWEALEMDEPRMRQVLAMLDAWKASKRWTEDGGAYIPNMSNFLDPKRQYIHAAPSAPKAQERKLDADEVAAVRRLMGKE